MHSQSWCHGSTSNARFLCHEDSVEPLLRASGSEGVFFKVRKVEPAHVLSDLELLWLPEQTTLDMARALAQHDHVLGVCAKGGAQQPRLALRFKTVERMAAFAKDNDIEDVSRLQRWKVVGLPISIGLHGLMVLFKDLAWELHSVLYFESDHAMVLAEKLGEHTLKYYTEGKQKHQIVFKALNASAKAAARTASQAAAAKAKAAPSGKASSPAASSSPPSIMALGSAMAARQSYVQQFDLTPRNKPIRIHESTGETPERAEASYRGGGAKGTGPVGPSYPLLLTALLGLKIRHGRQCRQFKGIA